MADLNVTPPEPDNTLLGDGTGQAQDGVKKEDAPVEGTPEEKAAAEKAAADKAAAEKAEAEKVPETYADFSVPDGITLDTDILGEFTAAAKEMELSQAEAQRLIDIASKNVQKADQSVAEMRKGWIAELKADKEFGGEKLGETADLARAALKKFGTDTFKDYLNVTGLGDNKELIIMLAKIGKAMGEDTIVDGAPPDTKGKSAAEVIYGGNNKQ